MSWSIPATEPDRPGLDRTCQDHLSTWPVAAIGIDGTGG